MQGDTLLIAGIVLVVVLSITSHEAAHGFVADRLGDPTARALGRLTLNPIPHIDVFFTILLPVFLLLSGSHFIFGGAKPVPVDVSRLHKPRRDWALVGVAGPVMNLLIAVLFAAVLSVCMHTGLWKPSSVGTKILVVGIFVNILLALFNLIPIPPLDGSRIVQYGVPGAKSRGRSCAGVAMKNSATGAPSTRRPAASTRTRRSRPARAVVEPTPRRSNRREKGRRWIPWLDPTCRAARYSETLHSR